MECPTLISENSQTSSLGDSTLSVQVANDSNIVIPVNFSSSSIHLSSVSKFKFPIQPPEPNRVQDKRSTLHIFQDMLGILNDTPKLNYKFYLDLLLKRDSGIPEINTDGVELSTELIKKAVKEYKPVLAKMKETYFNEISDNVITQHVKLSLPGPNAVLQGPLLFLRANIPGCSAPLHNIPLLADSCIHAFRWQLC